MFDVGRRVIGVMPTEPWQENAFPLRHQHKTNGKIIRANPFCRHFGLNNRRTVLFNSVEVDDEGVMSLPIDSLTAISLGSR